MRRQQWFSLALAVVLVAVFTGAVMGRVSWLYFWGLALALLGYVTYIQKP